MRERWLIPSNCLWCARNKAVHVTFSHIDEAQAELQCQHHPLHKQLVTSEYWDVQTICTRVCKWHTSRVVVHVVRRVVKARVGDGSIPSGEWRLGPSRTPVGRRVCCLLGRADSGAGDVKLSVTEARVLQVNPSHFEGLTLCLVDRHRQSDGELDAFNLGGVVTRFNRCAVTPPLLLHWL